jgi:hypothetical protein
MNKYSGLVANEKLEPDDLRWNRAAMPSQI